MKKILLAVFSFFMFLSTTYSQNSSIGIGMGLEYGGFGVNGTFISESGFGGFFGAGYIIAGIGINAGIQYSFNPDNKTHPFLMAMYGYNAAIVVKNAFTNSNEFSEIYYGPSFGGGVNIKNKKNNIWRISLSIPVRTSEFQDDMDDLKNSGVSFNEALPIAIGVGYNFSI